MAIASSDQSTLLLDDELLSERKAANLKVRDAVDKYFVMRNDSLSIE